MRTKTLRIPVAKPDIGKDEVEAVLETMRSGWVTQGQRVKEFERAFANYCGVKYGVATSSGTAALHIALASIGIKREDEVVTTPLSCVATANPILYTNGKPVFADVDPKTLNIDPSAVRRKITKRTRAILPVHLFGHPVDMDPLMETAEKFGLCVIEDAAHAHGAKYRGKKVGSIGHIACFSFYADKLITTVEGGMALTNDVELAEKMRMLRSFGMDPQRKFHHPLLGFNYKMSDVHASIGIMQMRKIDEYILKRRENVTYLNEQLEGLELKLPSEENYAFNVYYVYHVLAGKKKERVVEYLEKEGIETRPLVSFIPAQPPYQKFGYSRRFPVAEDAYQKGFYISNSPLLTKNELHFMASTLKKAVTKL